MKTLNKTIALLFAAAAFTACTKPVIDPVRPAPQPQSIIARPDTTTELNAIKPLSDDELPSPSRHKKQTLVEELPQNDQQPETSGTPVNQPTPRPVIEPATKHPKPRLDTVPSSEMEVLM